MKKQFKELLAQDHGTMKINQLFNLRRWVLNPETDILGRTGEYLELELCIPGYATIKSTRIESRTTDGMMKEIEAAMAKMMNSYTEEMCRRFRGGLI